MPRGAKIRHIDLKDHAAGDGVPFRAVANNEAVTGENQRRFAQFQSRDPVCPGCQRIEFKQGDSRENAARAVMKVNGCTRFDRRRPLESRRAAQMSRNCRRCLKPGSGDDVAARDVLTRL